MRSTEKKVQNSTDSYYCTTALCMNFSNKMNAIRESGTCVKKRLKILGTIGEGDVNLT